MALPVRRGYKGAPVSTTLASNISNSATSCTVVSVTGWPTTFPFFAVISPGSSKEEKVSVTGITSTTLTIERAKDDTSAAAHDSGATIYPVFTALEANEANLVASAMTTKGDLIVTDGLTINRLGVGTNAHVLQADSTATNGVKWGQVATAGIADGAVTSAKIADGTIVLSDLAAALQEFLVPTGSINAWATNTAPTGWQLCDGTAVSRTTFSALFAVIGTTYGSGNGSTTFNLPNLKGRVLVGRDAAQTEFDTLGETGGAKTHTLATTEIPSHQHNVSAYGHGVNQSNALGTHDHSFSGTVSTGGGHSHNISITDPGHYHQVTYINRQRGTGSTGTDTPVNWAGVPNYDTSSNTTGITASADSQGSHNHTFSGTTAASANLSHGHSVSVNDHPAKLTDGAGGGQAHNNLQPYMVLNYIIKN